MFVGLRNQHMWVLVLLLACVLSLIALAGCGEKRSGPPKPPGMSEGAASYLNRALDIMQKHSVNRKKIDWPALRRRAIRNAGNAKTPKDTYDAIEVALYNLGDHHSSFFSPGSSPLSPTQSGNTSDETFTKPTGKKLAGEIGYVSIPSFEGKGAYATRFADALQGAVKRADGGGVCGWIVDLRGNPGGNMWPMLAGIGPVLGEGQVGTFVGPDGKRERWYYAGGASRLDGHVETRVGGGAYQLHHPHPPVAVLIGSGTASSGEAIAVAFRGRKDTRFFGYPTRGVPTANDVFRLPDGAGLLLTVAADADREGRTYWAPINPDELVGNGTEQGYATPDDSVAKAAEEWLQRRPKCSNGQS